MSDAIKVGFVPLSAAARGILVVFCDDSLKVDTWFSIVSWTDEAGLTHKLNLDLNTVVIERGEPKA